MKSADTVAAHWRTRIQVEMPHADDDFVAELTDHVVARWRDVEARTGSASEADLAAAAELRSWVGVRPPDRPSRRHPLVGSGLDWRFALRMLRWRPSFAVSAAVLLAVGVATAATATAVVYGVLGRSLPYPDANRLVTVWERSARNGTGQVSFPDAQDLIATGVFETASLFSGGVGTFSGGVSVERVNVLFAQPAMLDMLGARAVKGRLFTAADKALDIGVISHRLWLTQFGGDENVVGRRFQISGNPVTIIGVLAPGFDFEVPVARTFMLADHAVWRPFEGPGEFANRREVSTYQVLARLNPGVTLERARSAAGATASRLAGEHAATNRDRTFAVLPLHEIIVEAARPALRLAAVGAAILLVAALANLAGLALARARSRRQELAVRRALGASTGHLIRQLVTEQLPLVAAGVAGGLIVARVATVALASSRAVRLPLPDAIQFDAAAWLASAAVAVLGLLMLAGPPWLVARSGTVVDGSTRLVARTPHRVLVVSEVAIAMVLAVAAALVGITLARLTTADAGFDPEGRLTFRVSAYAIDYPDKARAMAFFDSVTTGVDRLPGVQAVAASSSLPLSGQFSGTGVMSRLTAGGPTDRITGGWQHVMPGYFTAAGISLLRGREFTPQERDNAAHVSVLSETMARRLFGTIDIVGQRIQSGGGDDWHEVVGVAEDVRHRSLRESDDARVYDLTGQHWTRTLYFVVRTSADEPGLLAADIRRAIGDVSATAPVFEVATGEDLRAKSVAPERLATLLAGSVALVALLLAGFGIHAIIACAVAERRREMGVRIALGATRWRVVRLVVGDAGVMTGLGLAIGLAATWAIAGWLSTIIPGLDRPAAWPVIGAVSVLVTLAGLGASIPAARRAATVDPARVLQGES